MSVSSVQDQADTRLRVTVSPCHGHCVMMSSSVLSALVILSLVLSVDLRRSRSRSGRGDKDFSEVIKADGSGLFIWRIEDFSPVPLPEPQYTVFQIHFSNKEWRYFFNIIFLLGTECSITQTHTSFFSTRSWTGDSTEVNSDNFIF